MTAVHLTCLMVDVREVYTRGGKVLYRPYGFLTFPHKLCRFFFYEFLNFFFKSYDGALLAIELIWLKTKNENKLAMLL